MTNKNKKNDNFWVGLGSSAGGLEALQAVSEGLPENANMIYIIAQHLSPKHESMLTELIQRNVKLKVETIKNGVKAQPNTVYITPPNKDVFVKGDKIHLAKGSDQHVPKPSVDKLFLSLAEEKGECSIGVILSGTGSDGAHGVRAVQSAGGMTLAQDPDDAKYNGMPNSAIETGSIDFTLKATEIGSHLSKLSSQLSNRQQLLVEKDKVHDHLGDLFSIIKEECGISFKDYKKATLERRIERRMVARNITDFVKYVKFMDKNREEAHLLFKDILISVTDFFRDPKAFDQAKKALKEALDDAEHEEPFRIWSVGCATGEEPYSLAILLSELVGGPDKLLEKNFQVFATDVDTDALSFARKGIYPEASLSEVSQEIKDKYFIKSGTSYEVIKPLKEVVLFAAHNVIEDPPFLRMNFISCRNLLIYFESKLQKKIYHIFHYALLPNGTLFLGKSESTAQTTSLFKPISQKEKIFQKINKPTNDTKRYIFSNNSTYAITGQKNEGAEFRNSIRMSEALIKQLADASILVNETFDVEHIYGDIMPYIRISTGRPQLNLLEIITDIHKQELRALSYKALRTEKPTIGQPRKIKIDGELFQDRLKIIPLISKGAPDKFLLVCFEKLKPIKESDQEDSTPVSDERTKELEDELKAAREHLQTVIEELETSNEELQSLNEELQSANEELQSSNEELETTNEELQSANEELVTMNDELNTKTTEMETSANTLSNIKNSLDYPLVVLDDEMRILKMNKKGRDFFEVEDENQKFINFIPQEFEPRKIIKMAQSVIENKKTKKAQLEIHNKFYWLNASPFRDHENNISGAVLNFIENTDMMEKKRELQDSRRKEKEANKAKSEFLANISHEIRTPLNAIIGASEILDSQDGRSKKDEKFIGLLKDSALDLKDLINDLLDFAKLEAGQVNLDLARFSLKSLIKRVVDLYASQATEKDLKLRTSVDKDLPQYLMGDEFRIRQILANLISNAIKFTSEGHVELNVSSEYDIRKNRYNVIFKVSDTGIGIKDDDVNRVFDKFSQADGTITKRYGGTGLGLSIVRELVDLMDGKLSLESTYGEGSCFEFSVPLKPVSKKVSENKKALKKSDLKIFKTKKQAEKSLILIVEDNPSNIEILSHHLEEFGCIYDVAMSGKQALDLAKKKDYACVLMDIQMEGLSGFETYSKMKSSKKIKTKDMKVFAVSAHVQDEIKKKSKEIGMDGFVEKPIEIQALFKILNGVLGKEKS